MRRLHTLAGKRVLLLQGPVGPFFQELALWLQNHNATVHKVNFHAGDRFFYRLPSLTYTQGLEQWSAWIQEQLQALNIQCVVLYGDCRPVHKEAIQIARSLGIKVYVFEEGYVRPGYITFEEGGVNGHSSFVYDPKHTDTHRGIDNKSSVGAYWKMVSYGVLYFGAGAIERLWRPCLVHHRKLSLLEGWAWFKSAWRKQKYRWLEKSVQSTLVSTLSKQYYLVPLQVFNDAQLSHHSNFAGVEAFIEEVITSFATHADSDKYLVLKHHPMDRGYRDYTKTIRACARALNVEQRVIYIHDQHLPTIISNALGMVVINSTLGLSALHHGIPLKVCGKAVYTQSGLVFGGDLDDFWARAPQLKVNPLAYLNFRNQLIQCTQIKGSFYVYDWLKQATLVPDAEDVNEYLSD